MEAARSSGISEQSHPTSCHKPEDRHLNNAAKPWKLHCPTLHTYLKVKAILGVFILSKGRLWREFHVVTPFIWFAITTTTIDCQLIPYLHPMCQDGYNAETALLQTLTRHTVTSACMSAKEITSLAAMWMHGATTCTYVNCGCDASEQTRSCNLSHRFQ
jgi:hypothetical protein